MEKIKLGFVLCGSFCTFETALAQMQICKNLGYDIVPIFSQNAATIDTRFGRAVDFIWRVEDICGRKPITTLVEAEPIGPKKMTDILLVAPCTGNTLAKLANSITDTPATLAVKSHLRNDNPVVLAVSTNDALRGTAKNIGTLLNYKNYYFVPLRQDNPTGKPASIVADFERIPEALTRALAGEQIQPILL